MGKRPAEDELFVGNMGSIQREVRTSMQREDKPTMETGLERIAAKARSDPKLRFTSLAHHITRERVWTNLCQIPKRSAPGVDGPDRDGGKGDLRGMGGACAPIRSPPGISGTGHPARVYPEAWQAGKAPVGRPLRQRPGAPAQHRPGVVGHLRGGFFALLIWRTA